MFEDGHSRGSSAGHRFGVETEHRFPVKGKVLASEVGGLASSAVLLSYRAVPAAQEGEFGTGNQIPHPPQQLQPHCSLNRKETPSLQRISQWAKHLCSVWLGTMRKQTGPLRVSPRESKNLGITRQFGNLCRSQKHVTRHSERSGSSRPRTTPRTRLSGLGFLLPTIHH